MKRWSVVAGRCRAGEIQWRDDIFLADLAYHYDKLIKRKFDLAIDIWGADHHGYAEKLKKK